MKNKNRSRKPAKIDYEIETKTDIKSISLRDFEDTINSIPNISKDLAKRAIEYKYRQFSRIGIDKLINIGVDELELRHHMGSHIGLPSDDLQYALLPKWLRDALDRYWIPYIPRYKINFQNDSSWSHDYVVAYETHSGLVDIVQTTVESWLLGTVTCAPCWDIYRYAWAVWNPDDNVELIRTPTFTVDEINAMESVVKPCEDTWVVRIAYE